MAAEKMEAFKSDQGSEQKGEILGMPMPSEMPPPYSMSQQPISAILQQQPMHGMTMPAGTTVFIDTNISMHMLLNCSFGPDPMQGQCPQCRQCIITQIDYEVGDHAQSMMCLFCCLGGLLCVWIPCCVPSMQDVIHSCPSCKTVLGRFKR